MHDWESEAEALADVASKPTSVGESGERGVVGRVFVSVVTKGKRFKVEGPEGEAVAGSASQASRVAVGCGVGDRGR